MTTRAPIALAALAPIALAPIALAVGALAFQDADRPPDHSRVAALYRANCASCHLPPDPEFPVDRAWITQLHDTA